MLIHFYLYFFQFSRFSARSISDFFKVNTSIILVEENHTLAFR